MPELEQKSQRRQVAVKVNVKDIVNGKYVKEEGWLPNYIETDDGRKVSRVNLIGAIVFKSDDENFNYKNLIIDDGSGKISIRSFDKNNLSEIDVGDVILIIGRPREFNNEKYLIPEIVKKIPDVNWIKVRRLELSRFEDNKKPETIENVQSKVKYEEIKVENDESTNDIVINLIKKLDKGGGILIDDVIINSDSENAEKIINNLLENGDIFEVKPGIIKILE